MALPFKDPDDILDYSLDWTAWLGGDTIATSTWIVPAGILEDVAKRAATTTTTTIWLSGGTDGQSYPVTNRITTAQERTVDRTITIAVRTR